MYLPFYELGWTKSNDYSLIINFILRNTTYLATLFLLLPEYCALRTLKIEHKFLT